MLATPTQPGTTSRAGKPWSGASSRAVHLERDQDVLERLADGERAPHRAVVDAVLRTDRRARGPSRRPRRRVRPARSRTSRQRARPATAPHRSRRASTACRRPACPAGSRTGRGRRCRRTRSPTSALRDGRRSRSRVAQLERTSDAGAVHLQAPAARRRSAGVRVWLRTKNALGRRQVALVAHRLPAHLGVVAVVDEPLRRERLADRRRRRRGQSVKRPVTGWRTTAQKP